MNENKRPDPGSAAQSPRETDKDAPTNPERDVPRPNEQVEEREKPDRTGGTSVLGEDA